VPVPDEMQRNKGEVNAAAAQHAVKLA